MSSAYRQNPTTFPLWPGYLNPMSVGHCCKLPTWKAAVVAVLVSRRSTFLVPPGAPDTNSPLSHNIVLSLSPPYEPSNQGPGNLCPPAGFVVCHCLRGNHTYQRT
ncbi:hypothetical protein CSPX01_06662 [Colletotrichum filicis]|nr:hypothetical protein CSPX01_06662 [Colletotrichum filicis]